MKTFILEKKDQKIRDPENDAKHNGNPEIAG